MSDYSVQTVFVGHMPHVEDDPRDVFGAHVGMTLEALHDLRSIREAMENELGHSVTLGDCLAWLLKLAATKYKREAVLARQAGRDDPPW